MNHIVQRKIIQWALYNIPLTLHVAQKKYQLQYLSERRPNQVNTYTPTQTERYMGFFYHSWMHTKMTTYTYNDWRNSAIHHKIRCKLQVLLLLNLVPIHICTRFVNIDVLYGLDSHFRIGVPHHIYLKTSPSLYQCREARIVQERDQLMKIDGMKLFNITGNYSNH